VPGMGSTPHRVVHLRGCRSVGPPASDVAAEGIVDCRAFTRAEIDGLVAHGEIRSLVTLGALLLVWTRTTGGAPNN